MNYKTTLVLLLLLLVTGGAFFWLKNRTSTTTIDGDVSQGLPLVADGFPVAKVQTILVQVKGEFATFQKQGDAWWQTRPARFELNDWAIRDLLEVATSLRSSAQLVPGKNDAPSADKLGFASPSSAQAVLKLLDETGRELLSLRLGRFSLGGRAYLAIADDPKVHVVADRLHQKLLNQPLTDWRRKTLHPAALGQIDRMILAYPDRTIDMKQVQGHWSLADRPNQRIDTEKLAAIIGHLNGTFIQKFIAQGHLPLEDFGFDRPTLTITMHRTAATEKSEPVVDRLTVGSPSDLGNERYYAIWSTTLPNAGDKETKPQPQEPTVVWEIAKNDLDKLSKKLDDLRDGRILLAPPNEVHEILVKTLAESHCLKRNGGTWQLASLADQTEPAMPLDQMDVAKIIADLSLAKALGYAQDAWPTAMPLAHVTLRAAGRSEPEALTIFASEKPNQRLVYRHDEPVGYYINSRSVDALTRPAASLRDRTLLAIAPEKIRQITLRYRGQKSYVFSQADSVWTLNGQGAYEKPALDALLKTLGSLRVARWIVEVPATQPMADLTLQVLGDQEKTPLVMHLHTPGRIGYVPGLNLAELDEATVAALTAEMADRTIISLSPTDIGQVTVRQADRPWTVKRLENGRYFSDERLELNHADAAAGFDALGGLRAVRFVESGDFDQATLWATLEIWPSNQAPPIQIQLARRDPQWLGRLKDRTFVIDSATAEKLQRMLRPPPESAKP